MRKLGPWEMTDHRLFHTDTQCTHESHAPSLPDLSVGQATPKAGRRWTLPRVSSLRRQRRDGGSFHSTLSAGVFATYFPLVAILETNGGFPYSSHGGCFSLKFSFATKNKRTLLGKSGHPETQ